MAIDVNLSTDEMNELHDDLKAFEAQLAVYLLSPEAQQDPDFIELSKLDIQLNLGIYNLSIAKLQLAGIGAGQAVDAINAAVADLNAAIDEKAAIEKDLALVQSAVSFVVALSSGDVQRIIKDGETFANRIKTRNA